MASNMATLRPAGKTERRCIMRQELGFYRNLTLTALYKLGNADKEATVTIETFLPALKLCIATHPILSCSVSGSETEAPLWVRPETIDLRNNVKILPKSPKDELQQLQDFLTQELDAPAPFTPTIAPWKIVVLPLNQRPGECYIMLSTSHALADGQSCLAFHRTLLRGLNSSSAPDADPIVQTPSTPLLPPLDAIPMPVSWSFLLGPLLGTYLPTFITAPLKISKDYHPTDPNMWLGTPCVYDPSDFHIGVELVVIPASTITAAVQTCRAHSAKLTGLLHQLIVRALSAAVPDDPSTGKPAGSFGANTAMNIRRISRELTNDHMGVWTNSDYEIFPRAPDAGRGSDNSVVTDSMWTAASSTTAQLAARARSLSDQPVGLLKYLAHFRMWLQKLIGKPRDSSYELTNVMAFDPLEGVDSDQAEGRWTLGRTLMAQPANAVGCPLEFNVASRKGGEMVIVITWQKGVLGLERDEGEVVREIGRKIGGDLEKLAGR